MAKTVPSSDSTVSLKADQKAILLSSLAQYLERNGFSKTLKKLQSEAKIEKDGIKGTTPNLEEIYKTYFDSCVEVQLEEPDNKVKEKKKKKSKVISESINDQVESQLEPERKAVSKSEKVKKSKDKKKKKENVTPVDTTKEEQDDTKTSKVDVAIEEGKASKKRKRVASEENDAQLADDKAVEDGGKAEVNAKNGEENKDESDQVGLNDTDKTPMKMNNVQENGNIEKSTGKLAKKQRIGSAEPTSLKAFQRIKLDEVVFTDERLQDNSYWAKGGAETGYGAKAQEVLGQVRGRGFRHEKTKKKRGSYRGGQIDLQSHSVKFNYSDEE